MTKRIWRDYMGGTVQEGQRLWFYADVYEGDNKIGLVHCFRKVHRNKDTVIPYGPGYIGYFSDEVVANEEEFSLWDASWKKKVS